jgi:hypothetical protein
MSIVCLRMSLCILSTANRVFDSGIVCDNCNKSLVHQRFICLTCLDSDISMTFDICPDCMDKPAEREDFTHSPEHTMIKCRQYPQPYFFSWLVREARSMAERLKKALGELATKEDKDKLGLGEHRVVSNSRPELQCACCTKPVAVPCWACVVCGMCDASFSLSCCVPFPQPIT